MSDLPQRTGPPPQAIDVDGREALPATSAPPPLPEPVEATGPPLTGPELVEEGTRLVVGSAMLVGRMLRQMLDPSAAAAASNGAGADGSAVDDDGDGSSEPDGIVAALPTALLGWGMQTQRRTLEAAIDARERLGPALSWMLDQPFVSPAYQRVRSRVFDWYEVGETEKAASSQYAAGFMADASDDGLGFVYESLDLNAITAGFDVSPLLQNLELNDVIVHSTGGLATLGIDKVRAQGVTIDAVVHSIVDRILFRRRTRPLGPPGTYGLQQQDRFAEVGPSETGTAALPSSRP
jgi:hypothetical protein